MKVKKFLVYILFPLFFLSGCGAIPYNPDLFKANPENCWPCTMYQQAFKAIDDTLDGGLNAVAGNSFTIMYICLLFWILWRVGKLVSSLGPPNLKKEISEFAIMGFKVVLVSILLKNPDYFYDLFGAVILQPIGQGFLEMSGIVLQAPSQVGIENITSSYTGSNIEALIKSWIKLFEGIGSSAPVAEETVRNSKMFGELALEVQKIVFQVYDALWRGIGLGFQLLILADMSALFAALLLIGGLFWLLLRVPLAFIDAFLRIGFVLVLMPLLLVGWLFSYPNKVVNKVIHIFFSGFFDILFTCIYIVFLISLFRVYESQELPYLFSTAYQTSEGGMRTTGASFSTDFTILTVLTWSMLMLAGKVQDFTNFFFEGAEKSSMGTFIDKTVSLTWKAVKVGAQAVMQNYAAAAKGIAELGKEAAGTVTSTNEEDKQE